MRCSNWDRVEYEQRLWLSPVSVYYIQTTIITAIRNVEAKDMDKGFMALTWPQYLRMIYSAVQERIFVRLIWSRHVVPPTMNDTGTENKKSTCQQE